MNNERDAEDLALDIESRRERDIAELAAWRNAEVGKIDSQEMETKERLAINNSGIFRDYQLKRAEIEKEYQNRRVANENRYYELQNQLYDGKLNHVWIDAKDEKSYNEAKKLWDSEVKDRLTYGKQLTEKDFDTFELKYGSHIVKELKRETEREMKAKREIGQKYEAERQERARQHEQALSKEKQHIDVKQPEQKPDRFEVEEQLRQERQQRIDRIMQNSQRNQEQKQAAPNPIDQTGDTYEAMLEQYKRKQGIKY